MNHERLKRFLTKHGLAAVIGTSPENIQYASGFEPFQGVWNRFPKAVVVTPDQDKPTLVLPIGEVGYVADSGVRARADVVLFGVSNVVIPNREKLDATDRWIADQGAHSAAGLVDGLLSALKGRVAKGARIAVDRTGAAEILDMLRDRETGYEFVDRGEDLWRIVRMVKTAAEVVKLRRAIMVNEAAIDMVHSQLGHRTERELEAVYAGSVMAGGGRVQHWSGATGYSAGCFRLHSDKVLQPGERFRFDCGVEVAGYCSDIGGTAQLGGEPSADEKRIYTALSAGIDEARTVIRPGIKTTELYERVIGAVRRSGLPDYRYSLVGHGIGVEPRDYPVIAGPLRAKSPFWDAPLDVVIEAGMVLNIECPYNLLGEGAYQHEVTLLVEADGVRLLSQYRPYRVIEI